MRSILAFFLFFGLTAAAGAQTLNPGDTIAISVYQDSKLDRQIVIGPTGFISFPLAGQVRAGGLTPEGLENALKARLKDKYATDLDVTVTLVAVSREREREREKERIDDELKPRIFVTGEVQKPGPFFMRQRTTVLQAIAL